MCLSGLWNYLEGRTLFLAGATLNDTHESSRLWVSVVVAVVVVCGGLFLRCHKYEASPQSFIYSLIYLEILYLVSARP